MFVTVVSFEGLLLDCFLGVTDGAVDGVNDIDTEGVVEISKSLGSRSIGRVKVLELVPPNSPVALTMTSSPVDNV